MGRLQIVGAGGLGRELYQYLVDAGAGEGATFLDDTPGVLDGTRWAHIGVRPIGEVDAEVPCLVALGSPTSRASLCGRILAAGARLATFVHPRAYVAGSAELAEGCLVGPLACIGPQAKLARNVLVGPLASVGHDSVVGESAVLSPHATLNGHVELGAQVFLGTHAAVTPRIVVGPRSKIAAGAVVYAQVPADVTAMGNPARWRAPSPGHDGAL